MKHSPSWRLNVNRNKDACVPMWGPSGGGVPGCSWVQGSHPQRVFVAHGLKLVF